MAKSPDKQFDADAWTKKLAECIELELLTWRVRMSHDKIRALALECHPWHENALSISFLTDRESFEETKESKWSVADWRMYNFTAGPGANWPFAAELMRIAHEYYMETEGARARDKLVKCCAEALMSPKVSKTLKDRYKLADDFQLFVGHPDDPGKNYCRRR